MVPDLQYSQPTSFSAYRLQAPLSKAEQEPPSDPCELADEGSNSHSLEKPIRASINF